MKSLTRDEVIEVVLDSINKMKGYLARAQRRRDFARVFVNTNNVPSEKMGFVLIDGKNRDKITESNLVFELPKNLVEKVEKKIREEWCRH